MKIFDLPIPGAYVIVSTVYKDLRGDFSRLYCLNELQPILPGRTISQINHSVTRRPGAIRGLHYQHPPHADLKIVRCLKGRMFDVAVDLRSGSPNFRQWVSVELSPENYRAIVIPEGCAHGFQVLEPDSELLYLHTAPYTPDAEGAVRFDDPLIGIKWPLEPTDISSRDRAHLDLDINFAGILL